jgi:Uma2 family endonuclease
MAQPAENQRYTYADYLVWDASQRAELINGQVYLMASPSPSHQTICFELGRQLGNFLEGKKCRAYPAPFDVRLFEKEGDQPEDVDTVVQPDLTVVCDQSKLDQHGCKGAPELVIEVLSPSSRRHDRLEKLHLYQKAGVPEYWIVDPDNRSVQVLLLDSDGSLKLHEDYGPTDVAKVNALEGCFIELCKVFPS